MTKEEMLAKFDEKFSAKRLDQMKPVSLEEMRSFLSEVWDSAGQEERKALREELRQKMALLPYMNFHLKDGSATTPQLNRVHVLALLDNEK